MPAAYKKNQKELLAKVQEQYDGPALEGPLRVEMELYGEGRADIWVDDRISIISELSVRWEKRKKENSAWIVRIYEIGEGQEELPF